MANWTPTEIDANLLGWWDSSDTDTITDSGGAVSQIDDKSRAGNDLVQATSAEQPTTDSRTQDGKNVLDFDGGDYLENLTFPIPSSGDISIFMVAVVDSVDSQYDAIFSMDATNDFQVDARSDTEFLGRQRASGIGSDFNWSNSSDLSGSWNIFENVFDYGSTYEAFLNGDSQGSSAYTTTALDTSQVLRIFSNRENNHYVDGAVAEVIIVNKALNTFERQRIEGYLAWKWGLESNLDSSHPYADYPPQETWKPTASDTFGWYDTSDENNITESGGAVSQVDDLSGNGEHLVQGSGALQPTTGTRTLDGKNVIDHDGSEWMERAGFSFPSSGNHSVFMVAVVDSVSDTNDSLYCTDQEPDDNDYQFCSGNASQFDGRLNVSGIGSDVSATGGPFPGPSIYNVNLDYTGAGVYNGFVDGTQRIANTTYSTIHDTPADFRVMTNRGEGQFIDGAWGEIIIVEGVLTTAERQRIEGYLAWKWGLEGNLPSGHPYENAPPLNDYVWDGGGSDNNWSTDDNWVGDGAPVGDLNENLIFQGSTRLTPNNDITADSEFQDITFESGAGAFDVSGNAIELSGNISQEAANNQELELAIELLSGNHDITVSDATKYLLLYGVLSGAGSITKYGDGGAYFTEDSVATTNTFSGGLIVEAGTAQGGAANDQPFGTGDITLDGGTLYLFRNDIANDIYTTDDSTLRWGNGFANIVTGDIDISSGKTLTMIVDYNNQELQGNLSGAGDLYIYGNWGTNPDLTFGMSSANSSFTGDVTLDGHTINTIKLITDTPNITDSCFGACGTVIVENGATLSGSFNNSIFGVSPSNTVVIETGGVVTTEDNYIHHLPFVSFDGGAIISVGKDTNWGNWNLDNGVEASANGGSFTGTGNITCADSPCDWNIASGGTLTVSSALFHPSSGPDNDCTKTGNGLLIIDVDSDNQGDWTISAGELRQNGYTNANSDYTVASGAILSGVGDIDGDVVIQNGGILQPGEDGIGTIGMDGDLTFNSTSILNVGLGTVSDLIDSDGANITIDGTVNIAAAAGFAAGTYTVITYDGALTDNTMVVGTVPEGYLAQVYTGDSGFIKLVVTEESEGFVTKKQQFGLNGGQRYGLD